MLINIFKGFFWQGIGMVATLLSLPISIRYLDSYDYGIWVTIYGVVVWLSGLDLGIGNGFRNELAASLAQKKRETSANIVSNAYISISVLVTFLIVIMLLINTCFYSSYFNGDGSNKDLSQVINLLIIFVGLDMLLRLSAIIYTSDLRSSILPMLSGVNGVFILSIVYVLDKFKVELMGGKIMTYALTVGVVPIFTSGTLTVIAFSGRYKYLMPKWSLYDFSVIKKIVNTGIQFFGIQMGMFFFLQLTNIMVSAWSNPSEVAALNVAEKYFGIISIAGSILLFPFWSKFTEADVNGEHQWIKKIIIRLELLFILIFLFACLMLAVFPFVKKIWIGDSIYVPMSYAVLIAFKYLFILLNSIYSYYLNGVGKVKIQLYLYFIMAALNLPCSYILFEFKGIDGLLLFIPLAMFCMAMVMKYYAGTVINYKIKSSVINI